MDDQTLIDLYWARDEKAIGETSSKYGKLCRYIANNILKNAEDCEECLNDTYFDSIEFICERTGFSQSKVKSILYEMRIKLRKYLESEGIEV